MEQNVQPKGSMLLKVVSILMIIGGIIGAIGSVIMIVIAAILPTALNDPEVQASMAAEGTSAAAVTGVFVVATIILIVSAVIEIIAGVKGKKNWNNPAAAKTLIIWGIVCAVLNVIGICFMASSDSSFGAYIVTGLVIPILYIIGAVQLKKQG